MERKKETAGCGSLRVDRLMPACRFCSWLLGSTILGCGIIIAPPAAISQDAQRPAAAQGIRLSIPAQNLSSAIDAFSRATGWQVGYSSRLARSTMTRAVSGVMSPGQALQAMLAGTGVSIRITGPASAALVDPAAANADRPPVNDGSLVLDTIEVSGKGDRSAASGSGYQGTPDWVYETPAAVSVISREAIEGNPSRNARDLLDNVAGVYANRSEAQNPGIAVNIRGLQDQDRIGMMIDGARQNFQRNGHGTTQRTYVDTAFVRAVEIEKSSTSGVGSLGTLGGFVNFRTIVADDLIKPGQKWGGEINAATGTNGFRFDGSASAAARISDNFSILAGISHKDIGPYQVGKNGTINLGTTYTGNTMLFSGQEVLSTILKAEANVTDDAKLTLGWVRNNSDFSTGNYDNLVLKGGLSETQQSVVNNTVTASFDWRPDGNLIDMKSRFYYNHTRNTALDVLHDVPDNVIIGSGFGTSQNYKLATIGGSLENTSRFDTSLGLVSVNYGAEAFRDDGKTIVPSQVVDGQEFTNAFSGGNPGGKRDVAGGFLNGKLEHDNWLTVAGGMRYDWYRISGSTSIYGNRTRDIVDVINHPGTPPRCLPPPFPPTFCVPGTPGWTETIYGPWYYQRYDVDVNRSEGAFLPSFTVAVKPVEWLQPFVKYSKSFRPPTIMESFLNSGHSGIINGYAPNPNLTSERGDTYELGANISADRIFSERDSIRFKVVGFYREIEDYIAIGRTQNEAANRVYTSFVNLNGTTRMRGVEVEANYDARSWYIGGTFTYNHADWAKTYIFNGSNATLGPETTVLFVQPEIRVVVDGGVRLFDEKLTIGGRMTHVGETAPTIGTLQNNYKLAAYTLYDLYGSFAVNDTTKLRFNITNLTDIAYISALGADYYAMPGRTATVSLNVKF
jgi:hemoglobin/transferrin/lactoferrin receptor protein